MLESLGAGCLRGLRFFARGLTLPLTLPLPGISWDDTVLGGSWVVISGVVSPLSKVISIVRGLITPLITTHEPPSGAFWQQHGFSSNYP